MIASLVGGALLTHTKHHGAHIKGVTTPGEDACIAYWDHAPANKAGMKRVNASLMQAMTVKMGDCLVVPC